MILPELPLQKNRLRILQVTPLYLPHTGGTEIHTHEVSRRFAAAGHVVTVLTTDLHGTQPAEEDVEGVRIRRLPAWPADLDLYYAPELYRFILEGDWDIVHCQGYHTLFPVFAMRAAQKKGTPYFVSFHSGGHSSWLREKLRPIQRAFLRPLLALAEGLIGVSNWEAKFFQNHLRLPHDKFHVISNGFSLPDLAESPSAKAKQGTLILSIGRLEKYKGHQRVIEALPHIAAQCPDVHLRIAGSGPYESSLRRAAARLRVADRVQIAAVSSSNRGGMTSLLLQSDLVVILSSYESQSIAALEALSLNRPLLVSDSTALREFAERGWARAVAPSSTAEEVAEAVLMQLRQPLVPANLTLPTWDACAQQLLSLYGKALQRK